MNVYSNKQRWKLVLSLLAIIISVASLFITSRLVKELKNEERKKIETWAQATKQLVSASSQGDFSLAIKVISENTNIPVILIDECDSILETRNIKFFTKNDSIILNDYKKIKNEAISNSNDSLTFIKAKKLQNKYRAFLRSSLQEMRSGDDKPIEINFIGDKQWIYYSDSELLNNLRYYPIYQLFFITIFILIGYMVFSSARKSEQNQVWAGMAKETAHQIGTPLSSLVGWTEILKSENIDPSYILEMEKDIERLKTITDRFSKVGSVPTMKITDVVKETKTSFDYLQRRSSKLINFSIDLPDIPLTVNLNPQLYSWTIENIVKNGIDAMKGKGDIHISITSNLKAAFIRISDTGKGISKKDFNTIFSPGVTSKKRGWGLGLSLAKRIIEGYHKGKIRVLKSNVNEGTTMEIMLYLKKVESL